jgi:hypothetical protein
MRAKERRRSKDAARLCPDNYWVQLDRGLAAGCFQAATGIKLLYVLQPTISIGQWLPLGKMLKKKHLRLRCTAAIAQRLIAARLDRLLAI